MPFVFGDATFLLLLPGLALALYAQLKVSSTFNKYARVPTARGLTGAEVAAELLKRRGIYGGQVEADPRQTRGIDSVKIERITGMLSDHYDPKTRTLRLSPQVYDSTSVAAVGVAAHETGHALQHRDGYAPLALRSLIVPAAQVGTSAAWILFLAGLLLRTPILMDLGILFFLGYVLFAMVTLPVEFNASSRAVAVLQGEGLVMPQETAGVRAVLNAAALTYVAAAAMAVLQLVRLVLLRGASED